MSTFCDRDNCEFVIGMDDGCVRLVSFIFFFFFKQKTAYEVRLSLVGSEMFIRDSLTLAGSRQDLCAKLFAGSG